MNNDIQWGNQNDHQSHDNARNQTKRQKGHTWEKWKLRKQHRGHRPGDFQWRRGDASSLWAVLAVCVMLSRSKGCRNNLEVLELKVSWSWNESLDLLNSVSEFHGKKKMGHVKPLQTKCCHMMPHHSMAKGPKCISMIWSSKTLSILHLAMTGRKSSEIGAQRRLAVNVNICYACHTARIYLRSVIKCVHDRYEYQFLTCHNESEFRLYLQ